MKRSLKFLSLLLMVMLVLTGCKKEDPKKQLENALEKLEKAESVSLKLDADLSVSAEGTTMAIGLGLNGDYSLKTKAGHFKANVSMFGMNEESEMYMEEKDGYTYSYEKDDEGWTYTKTAVTEDEKKETKAADVLKEFKSVKEVKSDKKGYTKLEVVISKDKLNDTMKENEEMVSELVDGEMAINKDVTLNVYLKDGEIRFITLDLADLLKDAMGEEAASADMKAVITLELSNYNKNNDLKVPEEVTKNAKEEVEMDLEDSEFDFEM